MHNTKSSNNNSIHNNNNDLSHIDNTTSLQHIINNQFKELTYIKQQLIDKEYELKEARYEINQFEFKERKFKDEKLSLELQNNEIITKLKTKLLNYTKYHDDYYSLIRSEYVRIVNGIDTIYQAIFYTRNENSDININSKSVSKVHKQLFDRVMQDVGNLKDVLNNSSSSNTSNNNDSSITNRLLDSKSIDIGNYNSNYNNNNKATNSNVSISFFIAYIVSYI